jgi:hypothetical protein
MMIDFVFVVVEEQWLNALLILAIGALILAPTLLGQRDSVQLPYEFQLVALVFAFAALFLGEVRSYYDRFWWWDIAMDKTVGTHMQKPMLGDASGLTDTMWDLIVDTIGALAISALGWWYMVRDRQSFIDVWTQKFIDRNPTLFRR